MHAYSISPGQPTGDGASIFAGRGSDAKSIRLVGVTRPYTQGQEIYGEGARADHVYGIISGAVRTYRVLADGRRQIFSFGLPGDVFGFDTGPERGMSVEALGDSMLVVTRRATLVDGGDAALSHSLWRLAADDLRRSQDHVLTLGRRTARERVAHFLNTLAARLGGGPFLDLPMSRQDIADYLGLTIETVSRTLTQFQIDGLIRLDGCRRVALCRPRALIAFCD